MKGQSTLVRRLPDLSDRQLRPWKIKCCEQSQLHNTICTEVLSTTPLTLLFHIMQVPLCEHLLAIAIVARVPCTLFCTRCCTTDHWWGKSRANYHNVMQFWINLKVYSRRNDNPDLHLVHTATLELLLWHKLNCISENRYQHSRMMFTNTFKLPNHSGLLELLLKYMRFTNIFKLPNHSTFATISTQK